MCRWISSACWNAYLHCLHLKPGLHQSLHTTCCWSFTSYSSSLKLLTSLKKTPYNSRGINPFKELILSLLLLYHNDGWMSDAIFIKINYKLKKNPHLSASFKYLLETQKKRESHLHQKCVKNFLKLTIIAPAHRFSKSLPSPTNTEV